MREQCLEKAESIQDLCSLIVCFEFSDGLAGVESITIRTGGTINSRPISEGGGVYEGRKATESKKGVEIHLIIILPEFGSQLVRMSAEEGETYPFNPLIIRRLGRGRPWRRI